MSEERIGDWMQTYTGKQFWPFDPRPEEIFIEDIAHHLSMLCRYNGACKFFYSVAEHSFLVSEFVTKSYALWGLMHDAAEAYISDIIAPVKRSMPEYKRIEERIMKAIVERFEMRPAEQPEIVSTVDKLILRDEQIKVMTPCEQDWWHTGGDRLGAVIMGYSPATAEEIFLKRFYSLKA